jgi:hypothetical protein
MKEVLMSAIRTATSQPFADRLHAAVEVDQRSVPAHRRDRNWHGTVQSSVANPRRTRGLTAEDFAERLRHAVG